MHWRTQPLILAIVVMFCSGPRAEAQSPNRDIDEIIVLLHAPSKGGPAPETAVDMINNGQQPGHGLGEGNPRRARLAIPRRATGRVLEWVRNHEESPLARLQRYIVLTYSPNANLDGLVTGLSRSAVVQHAEKNKRFTLSALIPNDPWFGVSGTGALSSQWGLHLMRFPEIWEYSTGYTMVGIIDTGIEVGHPDLSKNFREHFSVDYISGGPGQLDCDVDPMEGRICIDHIDPSIGTRVGHGTFVSGTLAAEGNNADDVAGACWDCPFVISRTFVQETNEAAYDDVARALAAFVRLGLPVVNFSAGIKDDSCEGSNFLSLTCTSLALAHERGIIFVAASGNDNNDAIHFPAIEDNTLSVGGVQLDNPETMQFSRWQFVIAGSNYGLGLDIVAPAGNVLGTAYRSKDWQQGFRCGDGVYFEEREGWPGNTGSDNNGVGPCSGTSLATPHISAAVAIMTSLNRNLSLETAREILKIAGSHALNPSLFLSYGVPDMEEVARRTLGMVGGSIFPNRVVPLFRLYSDIDGSYLHTTFPTIGSAAVFDSFESTGPLVSTLERFPGAPCTTAPCLLDENRPRASMFILTTANKVHSNYPDLVRLTRMRKDPNLANRCAGEDVPRIAGKKFAFATSASEVDFFKGQGYVLDAAEGYLFGNCIEPGCVVPLGTEPVYRLFNSSSSSYGLFLASELPQPGYEAVQGLANIVGHAYINTDTDGDRIIDGFEWLLGTSPTIADTDCDGMGDGDEFLIFNTADPDILNHGYSDPLSGPCIPFFEDSFEAGNNSKWSVVNAG